MAYWSVTGKHTWCVGVSVFVYTRMWLCLHVTLYACTYVYTHQVIISEYLSRLYLQMRYLSCWDVTGMTRLKCACMEIEKNTYFNRALICVNNCV